MKQQQLRVKNNISQKNTNSPIYILMNLYEVFSAQLKENKEEDPALLQQYM